MERLRSALHGLAVGAAVTGSQGMFYSTSLLVIARGACPAPLPDPAAAIRIGVCGRRTRLYAELDASPSWAEAGA